MSKYIELNGETYKRIDDIDGEKSPLSKAKRLKVFIIGLFVLTMLISSISLFVCKDVAKICDIEQRSDINGDGVVDLKDFSIMMDNWSK